MSHYNIAIVREFTKTFKNEHDVDAIDHLFHPEFTHNFGRRVPDGLEGLKVIGRAMNGTFPDVCVTEEDLIVEGDKVVERSSATGTHLGDMLGVPATGMLVEWSEIHIYRIVERSIIEHWVEWSQAELMQQLSCKK